MVMMDRSPRIVVARYRRVVCFWCLPLFLLLSWPYCE
jgi:hypothetical protein